LHGCACHSVVGWMVPLGGEGQRAERGETGAHNCSRGACRELSDAPDDARLSRGPADGVAARGGVLGTDGVRSAECGCGG
jgi:hypothetical protein